MSSPTQLSPASAARADAIDQVLRLEGVATVFPPTLAVVRSLATRTAEPSAALRLSGGTGPTEARLDIAVAAGHRAADVSASVQELVHRVLTGHGIDLSSVTVTVLEQGVPDTGADGGPAPRPKG
ncbi:hypothetical protein GCM10009596_21070 [Arthrobacter rhombi]|uniref:hypothetical protein n=1 Tax=Arthrobacter rhombi TaxID=71253 RepID=UPI0031D4766A